MKDELFRFALKKERLAITLLPDLEKYSEDSTYVPENVLETNPEWRKIRYDFQRILYLMDLGYYDDLMEAEKLIRQASEKVKNRTDMHFDDLRSCILSKEYLG